jgi:hypothetical protein
MPPPTPGDQPESSQSSAIHKETMMSNTQSDRSRVSASDASEVRYFADKHNLTTDQVLDLIKQHGNNRKALEEAVSRLNVS